MSHVASRISVRILLGLLALSGSAANAAGLTKPPDPASNPSLSRDLDIAPAQLSQLLRVQRDAGLQEAAVRRELGNDFAGSWIERAPDGTYRFVAASIGRQRASARTGVEIRAARYSWTQLQASKQRLDWMLESLRIGIHKPIDGLYTWHVDPVSNRVVVRIARGAQALAADFVAASGVGADELRFEYMDGAPQTTNWIFGGLAYITASGGGCTSGFVAYKGEIPGVVTAGHCGTPPDQIDVNWSSLGRRWFGLFENSRFPGADRGWIRSSVFFTVMPQVYDWAGNYITVKGSLEAPVGAAVCRSGLKTGYRCGQITAKNVTLNYQQGTVYGMTESNACSGFGDSGGPWIDPNGQAQGIQSGNQANSSDGHNCDAPAGQRKSWFDPINPILREYGLVLATG